MSEPKFRYETRPAYEFSGTGPFRADMVRDGDPYEISDGHAIVCMPTGERGGAGVIAGGIAIGSDPGLDEIGASLGAEVGYSPKPTVLRAPDLSVTPGTNQKGWVHGAPPLAIEYADEGQDERELKQKISELISAGTEAIWVVRLNGPRRVEVYHADGTIGLVLPGQKLSMPGVLKREVPIEALYDRDAALQHALENHLSRFGYRSLEEVRGEGRQEGRAEGRKEGLVAGQVEALRASLLRVMARRGLVVGPEHRSLIEATREPATLERWIDQAVDAPDTEAALEGPEDP